MGPIWFISIVLNSVFINDADAQYIVESEIIGNKQRWNVLVFYSFNFSCYLL